jgi:hypothetical protein
MASSVSGTTTECSLCTFLLYVRGCDYTHMYVKCLDVCMHIYICDFIYNIYVYTNTHTYEMNVYYCPEYKQYNSALDS